MYKLNIYSRTFSLAVENLLFSLYIFVIISLLTELKVRIVMNCQKELRSITLVVLLIVTADIRESAILEHGNVSPLLTSSPKADQIMW